MPPLLLSVPCKKLLESCPNWGPRRVNAPPGPCWGLWAAGGSTGRGTPRGHGGRDCPRAPTFLLQLEEMYSTVCKATKKKTQVPASSPREAGAGWPPPRREEGAPAGCWSPPAAQGTLDPCYESINDRAWTAQGCGPDPHYEAVDAHWKAAGKRQRPGQPCAPENLYESVGDVWAGASRRTSARTAANGLEVYITNL